MKKVGHIIKKVLFIALAFYLLSGTPCNYPPYRRPGNVKLLLNKTGYFPFNPVITPNSQKVYYLKCPAKSYFYSPYRRPRWGKPWALNLTDTTTHFLLDGNFCAIAISPEGSKLAIAGNFSSSDTLDTLSYLILIDTLGNILDTLPATSRVVDVEFSSDGKKLYYLLRDGVFHQNKILLLLGCEFCG